METHLSELMEHDVMYRNPDARWESAPRIVGKKQVGEYQMAVYLSVINAVMVPMTWPMPHLEIVMANVEGSTCYFLVGLFPFFY